MARIDRKRKLWEEVSASDVSRKGSQIRTRFFFHSLLFVISLIELLSSFELDASCRLWKEKKKRIVRDPRVQGSKGPALLKGIQL